MAGTNNILINDNWWIKCQNSVCTSICLGGSSTDYNTANLLWNSPALGLSIKKAVVAEPASYGSIHHEHGLTQCPGKGNQNWEHYDFFTVIFKLLESVLLTLLLCFLQLKYWKRS